MRDAPPWVANARSTLRRRFPRFALAARHLLDRMLSVAGNEDAQHRRWLRAGVRLARTTDLSRLVFDRDGVWVRDRNGALWTYGPEVGTFGLVEGRFWEPGEVDFVREHLHAGGVFVDVGASIGTFGVEIARTNPLVEVHAFEPVGAAREALIVNARKNGVADRVHVSHLALLDAAGLVSITRSLQGMNFVVMEAADGDVDEVESSTLDEYVDNHVIDRIDAMKVDVEGAELLVLKGGWRTLERDRPLLVIEIEERWTRRFGHSAVDVFELLATLGYAHHCMVEWRAEPSTGSIERDLQMSSNFIFFVPSPQATS
jgi:FkbM family methyltransferase